MTKPIHIPVLLNECVNGLELQNTDVVLDATIGFGGHSRAILDHIPNGLLIGLDQDMAALTHCQEAFHTVKNIRLHHSNFRTFPDILKENNYPTVTKIIADFGMSSFHLDSAKRGFSFQEESPLDMRMNLNTTITADDIINTYSANDLTRIFTDYGELYRCEKFVDTIIRHRKTAYIRTCSDLLQLIKRGFFFHNKRSRYIRTASLVFQALRIEVNDEINAISDFLDHIPHHLVDGGIAACISFHSLEDKCVKRFIHHNATIRPISKKVIKASQDDIRRNSRSKSAKLRLFQKVALS